ncbi:MAG: AAA family ATPase [Planctomycetaceae bacterium]|nr:MAG: AAA family ATPase [Planctomycetaceae bacterium]
MYINYWGLLRSPFDGESDLRSYYSGELQEEALLRLQYVIEQRKGAALLVGETGVGKSLLTRLLATRLEATQFPFVNVLFPQMAPHELLAYLAVELGADPRSVESSDVGMDRVIREIERQLDYCARQDRAPVLVIDEAHLIEHPSVFQTLRVLLNVQPQGVSPLTLLFVGQPELAPQIARVAPLHDRIAARCVLQSFDSLQTRAYVAHRLDIAGATRALFTEEALRGVHELSGGVPRRINRLCDLALLLGFADDSSQVTAAHLETAADEFQATPRRRAA